MVFGAVGPYLTWGRPLQWDNPNTPEDETSKVCLPTEWFPTGDPSFPPIYMDDSRFTQLASTCELPEMIRELPGHSDGVWIEHDSCVFQYENETVPDKYYPWPNCNETGDEPAPSGN